MTSQPDRCAPVAEARPGTGADTVLVLTGGDPPRPGLVLPRAGTVVAADSGARWAAGLQVPVDVLVGDMDSLSEEERRVLVAAGAVEHRHHPDKDATDTELALAVALDLHPARIVVVGGHGGRLDHALATFGALAAIAAPGLRVEAWMGEAQVSFTADEVGIEGREGELVSLLPVNGAVEGVTTRGLRWPLVTATLAAGTTWGISNEITKVPAGVTVTGGVLAVVRPHALDPSADRGQPVPRRPDPVDGSSSLADRRGRGGSPGPGAPSGGGS